MSVVTDPLGWFTIEIAEGWTHETEDCVTMIRGPLSAGILFVSGGRHARGKQQSFGGADFLRSFLQSLGVEVDDSDIRRAQGIGCRIYSYQRDGEGAHWRYWSVTDDETVLLLSYTCALGDAGRETAEVDEMVSSVRLFHSAPVH
jgi:hypothetical protein